MVEIPAQLKLYKFCKVRNQSKIPYEKDWPKKLYSYEGMKTHEGNYGVQCGHNDLGVIDCDNPALALVCEELLPETFCVETGSGGKHFYYIIHNLQKKIIFYAGEEHLGELQWLGQQVIGAGSIHPNLKPYKAINNNVVAVLPLEQLMQVFGKFMEKDKEKEKPKDIDPSAVLLKDKIPISKIAEKFGLKRKGTNWDCPFHDSKNKQALSLSDELGCFNCFGCEAKGDLVTFYRMLRELKEVEK